MPRVVACGGRAAAFGDFCTAIANGEPALLLVDSEDPVSEQLAGDALASWNPWEHLAQRIGDRWARPPKAENDHCHLMAQCTESWFLADVAALKSFFDPGFKPTALPSVATGIESVSKAQIYRSLAAATKDCKTKGNYGKSEHAFKLLALVDPVKVMAASPWARRFVEATKRHMGC